MKKTIVCTVAYIACVYFYGYGMFDFVGPSMLFLFLPSCHAFGASLRTRYDEEILPRFTRDLASRGIALSDETHEQIRDWLVNRQMVLYWKPDGLICGYRARRIAEAAAFAAEYALTMQYGNGYMSQ